MTDDHFPDLLREVGEVTAETVQAFGSVVDELAENVSRPQTARLVEIAHGHLIDRDDDDWFWRPFRDVDGSFPATDAVPLHGRLADACLRNRLDDGATVDAMLIRLADLTGWEPITNLLQPAARRVLVSEVALADPPTMPQRRAVWGRSEQKKLTDKTAEVTFDVTSLTTLAEIIGASVDTSVNAVWTWVEQLVEWSSDAHRLLDRELAVSAWLIAGVRSDGTAWTELDAATVAVDAAFELASLLGAAPPEARHEQMLRLVLRAADAADSLLDDAKPTCLATVEATPAPLRQLTPLRASLAEADGAFAGLPAPVAAVRLLWESTTTAAWETG